MNCIKQETHVWMSWITILPPNRPLKRLLLPGAKCKIYTKDSSVQFPFGLGRWGSVPFRLLLRRWWATDDFIVSSGCQHSPIVREIDYDDITRIMTKVPQPAVEWQIAIRFFAMNKHSAAKADVGRRNQSDVGSAHRLLMSLIRSHLLNFLLFLLPSSWLIF